MAESGSKTGKLRKQVEAQLLKNGNSSSSIRSMMKGNFSTASRKYTSVKEMSRYISSNS